MVHASKGATHDEEVWRDHPDLLVRVSSKGRIWSSSSRKIVKPQHVHFGAGGYRWAVKIQRIWYPIAKLVKDVWGVDVADALVMEYDPTPIPNGGRKYRHMVPVYCHETGCTYESMAAAGRAVGLSQSYISRLTHGHEKSQYWHFSLF